MHSETLTSVLNYKSVTACFQDRLHPSDLISKTFRRSITSLIQINSELKFYGILFHVKDSRFLHTALYLHRVCTTANMMGTLEKLY